MDNMIWNYYKNLMFQCHIKNLGIEIPADDKIEKFLLNRETCDYPLSLSPVSLHILKAEKSSEQTKEKWLRSLYIGYLYVNLNLQENIFLYEPLLLFPVNISAKNNAWYLSNINEMNIILNYKLIFQYFEKNHLNYICFLKEFKDLNDFGENKLAGILAHLEKNNFSITNEHIQYIDKKAGLFILPSSFYLFKNYEEILSGNKSSSPLNDPLQQAEKPYTGSFSSSDLLKWKMDS